jgi:hypothetical protein
MEYFNTFSDSWSVEEFEAVSGWRFDNFDFDDMFDYRVFVKHGKNPQLILGYWVDEDFRIEMEHKFTEEEYLRLFP